MNGKNLKLIYNLKSTIKLDGRIGIRLFIDSNGIEIEAENGICVVHLCFVAISNQRRISFLIAITNAAFLC